MSRALRVVDWVVPVAPAERLAVVRIAVAGFLTIYLVIRSPVFFGLSDNMVNQFEPIGVLASLESPLPATLVTALVPLCIVLSAMVTVGAWHRTAGPLLGLSVLILLTYRSSWGQILWFEILIALHVLIIGFSPAADVLSVRPSIRRGSEPSISYGWPVQLLALVTVATYVLAGLAKIRHGGIEWFTDESMRNHLAFSAARLEVLGGTPSPVAAPLVGLPFIGGAVSWVVVSIELLAPVAFIGHRLRWAWIAATWMMHVVIAMTMFVVFPFPLFGVAFLPLLRAERLVPLLAR